MRYSEIQEKEEKIRRLTDFLAKESAPPVPASDYEARHRLRHTAIAMLHAEGLLSACEFALVTMESMSSEQFREGGDKLARRRLREATANATEHSFDSTKLESECREAIEESLRINREQTV
jgi:hypothetical protein